MRNLHPRSWRHPPGSQGPADGPAVPPRRTGQPSLLRLRLVLPAPPEPWPGEGAERIHGCGMWIEDIDTGRRLPVTGKIKFTADPQQAISARASVLMTEVTVDEW